MGNGHCFGVAHRFFAPSFIVNIVYETHEAVTRFGGRANCVKMNLIVKLLNNIVNEYSTFCSVPFDSMEQIARVTVYIRHVLTSHNPKRKITIATTTTTTATSFSEWNCCEVC